MSEWVNTLSRVLYIDLARKSYWIENREDLFGRWLGGIGVATQLYREEVPRRADPLSPENAVILSVGPLTGVFPMASKTIAVFKSPLNGFFAESHAGGRSASAIRFAGYGAIVIRNSSDRPVYLIVEPERVRFRDGGCFGGLGALKPSEEYFGKSLQARGLEASSG